MLLFNLFLGGVCEYMYSCMLVLQSNCVEQLLDSSKVKITSGEASRITDQK